MFPRGKDLIWEGEYLHTGGNWRATSDSNNWYIGVGINMFRFMRLAGWIGGVIGSG